MKASLILLLAALSAFLIAAAAVAPPAASGELIINVNQSTNLSADYVRVTSGRLLVDNAFTNFSLRLPFEVWKTNDTPVIVSRGQLELTMPQLSTLLSAGNPRNALKTQILIKAGLIEKP